MDELALDLCCYGPQSWSAEVSERDGGSYVASATGTTPDEARDAVLAQLTSEQLADLTTSMIADLAAVARVMWYRCEPSSGVAVAYTQEGLFCGVAFDTAESARHQVLGYALALDTLRRDQEAADG